MMIKTINDFGDENFQYYVYSEPTEDDYLKLKNYIIKNYGGYDKRILLNKDVALNSDLIERLTQEFRGVRFSMFHEEDSSSNFSYLSLDEIAKVQELNSLVLGRSGSLDVAMEGKDSRIYHHDIEVVIENSQEVAKTVEELKAVEVDGRKLSPLETFLALYLKVNEIEDKKIKINREKREARKKAQGSSIDKPICNSEFYFKNSNVLSSALRSLGLPSIVDSYENAAVSKMPNGAYKYDKIKNYTSTTIIIDDPVYNVSGVYHTLPMFEKRNKNRQTICYALLVQVEIADLISDLNKQIVFRPVKSGPRKFEELLKLIYHAGLINSEDLEVSPEEVFDSFKNNDYFKELITKRIENFSSDLYDMKANDKSVSRLKFYGEGSRPVTENIQNFPYEVFEDLFKQVCYRLTNDELSGFITDEWQQQFNSFHLSLERKIDDDKARAKIFSEEYRGFSPKVLTQAMTELAGDAELLTNRPNLANIYKEFVNVQKLLTFANIFDKLDYGSKNIEIDKLLSALTVALRALGHDEEQASAQASIIVEDSKEWGSKKQMYPKKYLINNQFFQGDGTKSKPCQKFE